MRYCDGIGHIYCICCLANGKLYIGQTVKSIEKRFKEHKQAAKRGVPYRLYSAMRKYGVENFTIEEIIQVSAPNRQALKAKLCYIEERLIKRLQTKEFGYNSTDGGMERLELYGQKNVVQKQGRLQKFTLLNIGDTNILKNQGEKYPNQIKEGFLQ